MRHEVRYGQGAQPLYHVPYDDMHRPAYVSSATYAIFDLRQGDDSPERTIVAAGTAATVDSVSTTLTAAAGPSTGNDRRALVTANTNIVAGRPYLLSRASESGAAEVVTVDRIDATTLYTREKLVGEFASADLFRGVQIAAEFPAIEADDEDATVHDGGGWYEVVWTYTIDGKDYVRADLIEVVRYSPDLLCTPRDLLRYHDHLGEAANLAELEDACTLATEMVHAEIQAVGLPPAYYRTGSWASITARMYALAHVMRKFGGDRNEALAEKYESEYQRMVHNLQQGKPPRDHVGINPHDDMPDEKFSVTSIFDRG